MRATGGGVLLELAIHHVDLWRYLTGAEVDEVAAFARSGEREDETATLVARMSDGALATAVFAERTSRSNDVDVWGRSAVDRARRSTASTATRRRTPRASPATAARACVRR